MDGKIKPLRILMVDDSKDDFMLFQRLLDYRPDRKSESHHIWPDFELTWAQTVAEAIQKLEADDYDAVLLDVLMPDVQGYEGLYLVAKKAPLTPIVMLTGMAREGQGAEAIEQGAQDYVHKENLSKHGLTRTLRHAIARLKAIKEGVSPMDFDKGFLVNVENMRGMRAAADAIRGGKQRASD